MDAASVRCSLAAHRGELEALGVSTLGLFGSVVRKEASPQSDVDLLVEFTRQVGLFGFVRLHARLEGLLEHRVDLTSRSSVHPALRDIIEREAVNVF